MSGREPLFISCTPKGCIELLLRSGVEIAGKRAVVIGRSKVVGTPAAMLLQVSLWLATVAVWVIINFFSSLQLNVGCLVMMQRHNATVTVVHSHTPNPAEVVRTADIVIAAVGVANLVRGDWLKPGVVVIDVGMNAVEVTNALLSLLCYKLEIYDGSILLNFLSVLLFCSLSVNA